MRLIDADELLEILQAWRDEAERLDAPVNYKFASAIIAQVERMPTIEPERKKGKWIYKNDLKQFFCSECGVPSFTYDDVYIYSMDLPNFCEDCGADMREEGEQE